MLQPVPPFALTPTHVLQKHVLASDDGGITWALVATVQPMAAAELVQTEAGVFLVGTRAAGGVDNPVSVAEMQSADGTRCALPCTVRHAAL